jgi:NADP-dependent 3-hydroxy acid dehydrogenase YdfG
MVAEVVKPLGTAVSAYRCDLADQASIRRMLPKITAWLAGAPDILVNNAATFFLRPADRTSVEDFERTLAVNVAGSFAFIREFLPAMRERGHGHIVTIGSIADHRAFRDNAAYGASKYALRGLHEVLRAELRGSGVRTTLVSPGHTDTAIWDGVDADLMQGVSPRAKMLPPRAVAEAVRYAVAQPAEVNVDELRLSRS